MVWSGEHRAFVIERFIECGGSIIATQRAFRIHFGLGRHDSVPHHATIKVWVSNFRQTGSALKKKSPGRPRTATGPENVANVRAAIERSPRRSARKHSLALRISNRSIRRILHSASLSKSRSASPTGVAAGAGGARSPSPAPSHPDTWTSDEGRKHKKSKKKHRKHSPIPKSPTPEEGGITDDEQVRHKSKKSKRSAPSSPEDEQLLEISHKPKKKKDKKDKKERSAVWSDAELESRRAALLAQLHEHEAD